MDNGQTQSYPVVLVRETEHTRVLLTDDSKDDPAGASHEYVVSGRREDGALTFITPIHFQRGPIKEYGVNGIQNEDLLAIVIDRLEHFQKGLFKCYDNQVALEHCQEALRQLNKRTHERKMRGVEGTSQE